MTKCIFFMLCVYVFNQDAIKANSFFFPKKVFVDGDIDAGFREAEHVIEREMRVGGQEHYYMETQSCLALPQNEYKQMEVMSSTQFHSLTQVTEQFAGSGQISMKGYDDTHCIKYLHL